MTSQSSSNTAHEDYLNQKHFGNIDGLRFICISMVIWHHCVPPQAKEIMLLTRGFLGVDFFFVLSGFLITTLLLRETRKYGDFSLKNFYIRRIIRIIPVYYFVVTCVGIYYIFVKGQTEYLELWPHYYLFLSNFLTDSISLLAVSWSLSVEEQYYMVWPLLMLLTPPRYLWAICVVFISLNLLGILGFLGDPDLAWGPLDFRLPPATYAPIIMGSLAAIVLDKRAGFDILQRIAGGYATALLGFIALTVVIYLAPADVRGFPNLAIHTAMTFTLIALVVREKGILSPFLNQPFIARIGTVSYGIYLYHLLALDIVNRIGGRLFGELNAWAVLIVYCALSYLIAEISFRTLESWFLRFRPAPRTVKTET